MIRVDIPHDQLREICERWHISKVAIFGSAVRSDFSHASDIDLLVTFAPDSQYGFGDLLDLQKELENLFGKPVDIAERAVIETDPNHYRRNAILNSAEVVYEE